MRTAVARPPSSQHTARKLLLNALHRRRSYLPRPSLRTLRFADAEDDSQHVTFGTTFAERRSLSVTGNESVQPCDDGSSGGYGGGEDRVWLVCRKR